MLVVHGVGRPSKKPQDRYLAMLMAHKRISFAICYIKARISIKEYMKRGNPLLGPGPAGVKGKFVREFMLLLDGISVGDKSQARERVHPCNFCDKAVKYLKMPKKYKI